MANEREEGLAALQNGDFATAQARLEAAIAQNPGDAQAHLYLGGVYHQMKRNEDAVRVLSRATELQPMSAQAQYNLGIALEALGSHQQAFEVYRKAVALQDNYPLAQQGIERMQKAMQSAPQTGMYGAAPAPTGVYGASPTPTAYGAPPAPTGMYGTSPAQPGYEVTTAAPAYLPPPAPGYGAAPIRSLMRRIKRSPFSRGTRRPPNRDMPNPRSPVMRRLPNPAMFPPMCSPVTRSRRLTASRSSTILRAIPSPRRSPLTDKLRAARMRLPPAPTGIRGSSGRPIPCRDRW